LKSLLSLAVAAAVLSFSPSAGASALPGFRVQLIGSTAGFASSIAVDSHGTVYYTTTAGSLFRVDGSGNSALVARVLTEAIGDSGLLGMALLDDRTAVVHYTTPGEGYDVIAKIDLVDGTETVVQRFVGDISLPGRDVPPEHHGGNPAVGADGSIFVGIGDYGGGQIAAMPEWNGGKVFRIHPDGQAEQFARGFRNPFDMIWDDARQRLILCDNGPAVDDEINIVTAGGNYGWPFTVGQQPPIDGDLPPRYVFPQVIAPTGMIGLNGRNSALPRGFLIGAFVTKAIYYVRDLDAEPLPAPIPLIQGETGFVIDVTQAANGDVYFVTGNALYRLLTPARGDCNGDGSVDGKDVTALMLELGDGASHLVTRAQEGSYAGTWGCDVNGDSLIDWNDVTSLLEIVAKRPRPVRSR
jgi:glucose/arabinose dehydrogenase